MSALSSRFLTLSRSSILPSNISSWKRRGNLASFVPFSLIHRSSPCLSLRKKKKCLQILASLPSNPSVTSTVQEIIENVAASISPSFGEIYFTASGWQEQNGLQGMVTFTWASDGRFCKAYCSQETSNTVAFDGSILWRIDHFGRWIKADIDDRETTLITNSILSGFWLSPKALDLLQITLIDPLSLDWFPKENIIRKAFCLLVELHGGRVKACVSLDRDTYLPQTVLFKANGGLDELSLQHWLRWEEGIDHRFPALIVLTSKLTNQKTTFSVTQVKVCDNNFAESSWKVASATFSPSQISTFSRSKVFPDMPANLEVVPFETGHLVVKSKVDGQDGLFVMDSGACTLTIMPSVADELQMKKFGDLSTRGWQGTQKASFRRGASFQVGPLEISRPIFVETDLSTIIDVRRGESGNVFGICGYDVFAACVVEIGGNRTVSLFDPGTYVPPPVPIHWMELMFMSNIPVVKAEITVTPSSPPMESYLVIDTGAGGTHLALHSRAAKSFGLDKAQPIGVAGAKGLGQEQEVQALMVLLHSLKLGETTVNNVETFVASHSAGIEMSEWADGLICAQLITDFDVIFDYSRSRVAFLPLGSLKSRELSRILP